jgi:hypothetical protein
MASMIPLAIFAVLQVLDTYTTVKVLSQGGRELNPVLAAAFAEFGPIPVLIVMKAAVIAALAYFINEPNAEIVVWALCGIYFGVVVHNWRNMK